MPARLEHRDEGETGELRTMSVERMGAESARKRHAVQFKSR
jgi:hypothetical protein